MHYKLSTFRMFFHDKIQSYNTAHKQNTKPESNRQEVISTIKCYKDFHLYNKYLLSSPYSRAQPNRKEGTSQMK